MKNKLICILFLIILLSCSQNFDIGISKETKLNTVSFETDKVFQTAAQSCNIIKILSVKRQIVLNDIVHFSIILQVGNNQYDRITIHRVIQEKSKGVNTCKTKGIMLLHGSQSNFLMDYMPSVSSDSIPADQSIAIYFAKNDLDVWGVDMRYSLLPADLTDFSVMKNWDLPLELKDINLALSFARSVRSITGEGNEKMILSGISYGGFECYAIANAETQKPGILRNVSAILPMEIVYKFDPQYQNLKDAAYARYLDIENQINNGIYANIEGLILIQACNLSKYTPDEPSPIIPGFTNKQAFLFLVTSTYATSTPPLEPYVPFYHYLEGVFDENFMPVGLKYTNENTIYDLSLIMPPFCSQAELRDFEAVLSDYIDVPYDDHLNDITIPVFYIGSAGGFGKYGLYTLDLLGSTDKKTLLIQEYPDEYAALDYGHADLMWEANAKDLVWKPMLEWIKIH